MSAADGEEAPANGPDNLPLEVEDLAKEAALLALDEESVPAPAPRISATNE